MPWRMCLLGVIAATLAGSARADTIWWAMTGFGVNGVVDGVDVAAVAASPDGTIVVGGAGTLSRYSADGRPIGFGEHKKTPSFPTGTDCRPALAVRSDGTFLVACGETIAAVRPSGELKWRTYVAGAGLDSLAIDDLGRTVAAGKELVRVRGDGAIDNSFAQMTLPSSAAAVAISGGRVLVVVGGSILAYDDNGSPETWFGRNGVASFPGFTATSIGVHARWIVAGGSRGNEAAVVRFATDGTIDTSFGIGGIAAWDPSPYEREEVVALGMRHGGAVDLAVAGVAKADVYNSYEHPEAWLVQRVTTTGALGDSADGPEGYIDPTMECLQEFPVAIAEQPNGMTLVSGIACADATDYSSYSLLERYDQWLAPDVGVALKARITGALVSKTTVTVRVAVNGPCRLIARIQAMEGNDPIGDWLSSTRIDVAHGPTLLHLRLRQGELRPHVRYAVVVSAYDATGRFTNARALLSPKRS